MTPKINFYSCQGNGGKKLKIGELVLKKEIGHQFTLQTGSPPVEVCSFKFYVHVSSLPPLKTKNLPNIF